MKLRKLFPSLDPGRFLKMADKAKNVDANYKPLNYFTYFAIDCPGEMNTKALLEMLWENKNIEYAYKEWDSFKSPTVDAHDDRSSQWQGYLNPAPKGIDAQFAWKTAGGDGSGNVGFIDIELGWFLQHNDLPNPPIKILSGENFEHFSHGTGVLGIILAQDNDTGVVGITSKIDLAKTAVISAARRGIGRQDKVFHTTKDSGIFVHNISDAIADAIQFLSSGDVLLLELQIFSDIEVPDGELYPCELETAIFDIIRFATDAGIIVIEPAGNGRQDLDLFQDEDQKFIFDRNKIQDFRDSGAIVVGGARSDDSHSRHTRSNFGSRVDCFAWGENIKTTGDGPAGNHPAPTGYTGDFNGTSGAAAIVAGAVIAIQSMRKASGEQIFSPNQIREILRKESNSTMSADPVNDRIGRMPDLRKIYENEIR